MNSYLLYSQDSYLKEIFLEAKIKESKPGAILRFSFQKMNFKETAARIFNFSLFGDKKIYFLEKAELLKESDIDFLSKIDFTQLKDIYIFYLESKTYWLKLPRWRNIKGLEIKELKLSPPEARVYLEKVTGKAVSPKCLSYVFRIYQMNPDFKEIIDAFSKAALFYPESKEIDINKLKVFLEEKETSGIKQLLRYLKRKDLKHSIEAVNFLRDRGYKEERIFSSLIYRLAKEAQPQEAEFILNLELKFKTGERNASFILLELIFFYCHPEMLELNSYSALQNNI